MPDRLIRPRSPIQPLDHDVLRQAVRELADRDPILRSIHQAHGDPPLWDREPGFATLAWIVLGQQVSLASATAAFERLGARCGGAVVPSSVRALDITGLRACGLTRQKSGYLLDLATAIETGDLDLESVAGLPDDEARSLLVAHRGLGTWSADIYLLMALLRPDVWPAADLALMEAVRVAAGWTERPTRDTAHAYADRWRPWRSVAARMLWQSYLIARGLSPSGR